MCWTSTAFGHLKFVSSMLSEDMNGFLLLILNDSATQLGSERAEMNAARCNQIGRAKWT
jgi:hypothetical protein